MALTGFYDQTGLCHPDLATAQQAIYGHIPSSVDASNVLSVFEVSAGVVMLNKYSLNAAPITLISSTVAPTLSYGQCDPQKPFLDGMLMASAVLGVMMIAVAYKLLQKAAE